ncbi:MAG: hypothetical protein ACREM1_08265 [Longimicrobiales bacterium]
MIDPVDEPLDFDLPLAHAGRLVAMNLGLSNIARRQFDPGGAFQLPPPISSIQALQAPALSGAGTRGNGIGVPDLAEDPEKHVSKIT